MFSPLTAQAQEYSACEADINQNGKVDIFDYSLLSNDFFSNNLIEPRTDINGDGSVDLYDYSILSSLFFKNCTNPTPTETPSPTPQVDDSTSLVSPLPDWLSESHSVTNSIPTTGDLYVSTTGNDNNLGSIEAPFKTLQKAADTAQPGDIILVRGGVYNQKVFFSSSMGGTIDNYIILSAYPGEEVILDGSGITVQSVGGLVHIKGHYIRISGFTIQDVEGAGAQMGIVADWGAHHIIIDNNYTIRTASAGIGLWFSDYLLVRNNRIQDARTTGTQECLSANEAKYFEFSYNEVWNTQDWPQTCEGIDVKNGSAYGKVFGNVAHDLPLECIYIDAYRNHTHDIEVYNNHAYNCDMGIAIIAEETGLLENIKIYNNLFHDTSYIGIGFPSWGSSQNAGEIRNVEIYNNTIDNRRVQYSVNPTGIYFNYPNISNITIKNNIIATEGNAFVFDQPVSNLSVSHNLVSASALSSGNNSFIHPNLFEGDPLFVDYINGNYHLKPESPAINKGESQLTPSFDFDWQVRNTSIGVDLGAFSF